MILNRIKRIISFGIILLKKEGFVPFILISFNKLLEKFEYKSDSFFNYLLISVTLFRAYLLDMPVCYVIGDSHSRLFKTKLGFIVNHIGPATAFNLLKGDSTTQSKRIIKSILSKLNPNKVIILFVFGEIDCREHIYYQFLKNKKKISISELAKNTSLNYVQFASEIKSLGFKVCLLGIAPASTSFEVYYDLEYKTPLEVRPRIYSEFNNFMKHFSKNKEIPYIDLFPYVMDSEGFIKKKLTDDGTHLNKKSFKIIKHLLSLERLRRFYLKG